MADRHMTPCPDRCFLDGQGFPGHRRDRLFQQQVITFFHGGDRFAEMIPVHGGDDCRVAQFRTGEQVLAGGETVFRRNAEGISGDSALYLIRFGDSRDLMPFFVGVSCIDHSPLPRADQHKLHICLLMKLRFCLLNIIICFRCCQQLFGRIYKA